MTTTTIQQYALTLALLLTSVTLVGCGGAEQADRSFHTSGSPEADQRAEQRMAREEQLQGGEETPRQDASQGPGGAAISPDQQTLFARIGGEQGINAIVDDFVARALADPRVNWERKGVTRGGFTLSRGESMEWDATPANVAELKRHLAQFLAVATAGPPRYEGGNMKQVHEGMQITNAEFDAAVGAFKATLDKLQIRDQEQKEVLAIIESTRPQIVEER